MKILITGSGTLIGNSISKFLSKKKLNLISTYNKSYPKGLNKKNISIIKYDLKNIKLKRKKY